MKNVKKNLLELTKDPTLLGIYLLGLSFIVAITQIIIMSLAVSQDDYVPLLLILLVSVPFIMGWEIKIYTKLHLIRRGIGPKVRKIYLFTLLLFGVPAAAILVFAFLVGIFVILYGIPSIS